MAGNCKSHFCIRKDRRDKTIYLDLRYVVRRGVAVEKPGVSEKSQKSIEENVQGA
jgi:hypothetical protein